MIKDYRQKKTKADRQPISLKLRSMFLWFIMTVVIYFGFSQLLNATDYIWDGSNSSDWTTKQNWDQNSGYPDDPDDRAIFDSTSDDNSNDNTSVPAGLIVGEISLTGSYSGTVSMSGAVTLDNSGAHDGDLIISTSAGTFDTSDFRLTILGDYNQSNGTFMGGTGLTIVSGDFTHSAGIFSAETGTVMFGGGTAVSNRTLTLSGNPDFNNVIINDGLVGYWKLDETATSAADSSGYGNTGTWNGDPAGTSSDLPSLNYKNAGAIDLDGSGDYVVIPHHDRYNFSKMTVSAWVYVKAGFSDLDVIVAKAEGTSPYSSFTLRIGSGAVITGTVAVGGSTYSANGAAVLTVNTWLHVASTYDGETLIVYTDGSAGTPQTSPSGALNSSTADLWIGDHPSVSPRQLNGYIDEVRIYNRALSAAEVLAIVQGDQPATSSSVTTLNQDLDINGGFVLAAGTLSAGSNDIYVAKDWWNYGGVFTAGTGTVTFDGMGSTFQVQSGGQIFNNFSIDDTGGSAVTIEMDDMLQVSGLLEIYDGTLDTNSSKNYRIELLTGNWTMGSAGAFTPNTGTVLVSGDSSILSNGKSFYNFNVNDGLVAYWKLDETSAGAVVDSSGYEKHGVNTGATINQTGKFNKSYDFVSTDSDKVTITGYKGVTGTNPRTISAWIKSTSAVVNQGIVHWGIASGGQKSGFRTQDSSGTANTIRYEVNGGYVVGSTDVLDDQWHHVAMTWANDGTPNVLDTKLYVDGVLEAQSDFVSRVINTASGNDVLIGTNAQSQYFDGNIDDVRIYNRALTAAEILELGRGNQPGATSSTVTLIDTLDVNNDLILASGTLSAVAENITLAGDWLNYGGVYSYTDGLAVNASAAVTFDGASGIQQIASGGQVFNQLYILAGKSGSTWQGAAFSENVTIDQVLVVESGSLTADSSLIYFDDGADFRVGGLYQAIVTLDGVTVDGILSTETYTWSIRDKGDIVAKKSGFNSISEGLTFYTGSRIGSSTGADDGQDDFTFIAFNDIPSSSYGMDLTGLTDNDVDDIPTNLLNVYFYEASGSSSNFNVKSSGSTPLTTFILTHGTDFGEFAADTNGSEGADDDTYDRINWTTFVDWVSLSEFKALGAVKDNGVNVSWKTSAEVDNQGFNVYRSFELHGDYVKVNKSLIKPTGTAEQNLSGADYEIYDALPKRGTQVYYKLEDIDIDGKQTFHGPVSVDWDRDGLPDDWEKAHGFDNLNPDDANADPDNDGLTNLQEYKYGFDPRDNDSDEDGIFDKFETLNEWSGGAIPGINAGGEGLKVIGKDAYGITFEMDVEPLKQEVIKHRYTGWENTKKNNFNKHWKKGDNLRLSFSNMPTSYPNTSGQIRLPLRRVLLNVPSGRTVEVDLIKEEWATIKKLDTIVEPVPLFEARPVSKSTWLRELVKHKQIDQYERKEDFKSIKGRHKKNKFGWSAMFGGKKHRDKHYKVIENLEEVDILNETEIYNTPDSKTVEIYARNKDAYEKKGYAPNSHFKVGDTSNVGNQQAVLLEVKPVKYDPTTGDLKYVKKMRFRVNYIYDPKVIKKKTNDWRAEYAALNRKKSKYLDHAEAVEIKITKPAFSADGDLYDKTLIKLTWAQLTTVGVNWSANPAALHLYQGVHELSLKEVADGVVFYVDRDINQSMNNDDLTVYAVQDLATPGKRWGSKASELSSDQTLTKFDQVVRYEQNGYSLYLYNTPNTLGVNKTYMYEGLTKTFTFNTPGIDAAGNVDFTTRSYSQRNYSPALDCVATWTMNAEGSSFATASWAGHTFYSRTDSMAVTRFIDGTNTLKVKVDNPPDPDVPHTIVRHDYIDLTYPRKLVAINDKLLIQHNFASGITNLNVTGFSNPANITVLDVTDPTNIKEITGLILGVNSVDVNLAGATVTNPVQGAGLDADTDLGPNDPKHSRSDTGVTRILFIDLTSAPSITSAKKVIGNTAIRGRQTALDHIIIVDESLHAKAQELVDHLTSNGQIVEMVKYQDILKEYSDGEKGSVAISRYVAERWKTTQHDQKPQYLTIIGSGNFDRKLTFTQKQTHLIPSIVLRTGRAMKASASDWEFVKITDDEYPELSVGRLDCSTTTELGNIIDKIKAYENSAAPATPKALMVTDHEPAYDLYIFDKYMDTTAKSFESPWVTSSLKQSGITNTQISAGILDALNNNETNLMLYSGHGGWTTWGKNNFWNTGQMGNLQAGHFLPVVLEANCLSSDFYHPYHRSLGSSMLQKQDAGAIAVIGSTSITQGSSKSETFASLVDNLLRRGYPQLGQALLRAKVDDTVNGSDSDQAIASMNLLGLPSLKLKGALETK